MKRFFTLFTIIVLCSCQPNLPMDAMEEGNFVSLLYAKEATLADFMSQISELSDINPDILFFLDKKMLVGMYAISYETVDPFGKPTLASGLVLHPLTQPSKGLLEIMPIAHLDKASGATDLVWNAEGFMAYTGHTVLLPDLIGYGVSKDKPIPFLMTENTGRVVYDFRRAAASFLSKKFQYTLPSTSCILGYSMGGSLALAVQKYYETHHANTVQVKKVYTGGGVYDMPIAFEFFKSSLVSEYPAIPNILVAFNHYYSLNLDFTKIFTGTLLENWATWLDGSKHSSELRRLLGIQPVKYMHTDFYKAPEDQNSEFQKIHPYLVENSVSMGWTPKAPISFISSYYDTYVPADCTMTAYQNFLQAGTRVSLTRVAGDHNEAGYYFLIYTLLEFL